MHELCGVNGYWLTPIVFNLSQSGHKFMRGAAWRDTRPCKSQTWAHLNMNHEIEVKGAGISNSDSVHLISAFRFAL